MARPQLELGTWGKIGYSWKGDRVRAYANYRFADGTTAKVERWGGDEDEAKRALTKHLRSLSGETKLSRDSRVSDVAKEWLASVYAEEKFTTYKRYRTSVNNQIIPTIGQLKLHECRPSRLQKAMDELQRNYSSSTCSTARAVMHRIFKHAILEELMDHDPASLLKRIRQTDVKRIQYFDREELQEFLAAVDADPYMKNSYVPDLLRFLFGTGSRIGEAIAVRWQDLNLTEEKVRVTHPVFGDRILPPHTVWINGNIVYGEHGLLRHNGKTNTTEGILALPDFLHALLQFRLPECAPDERDFLATQPVFPSSRGGHLGPNAPMQVIKLLCRRIGYEDFTSHWGRKTVATLLRVAGHDSTQVRDQLRHATTRTAEKHYDARAVNPSAGAAIDALFAPPPA
jgi:integrase